MRLQKFMLGAALILAVPTTQAESQTRAAAPVRTASPALTYADLADLGLAAPLVAHVQIRDSVRLKDERAAGVAPGKSRFYVEADVLSLIRSPRGVPSRIGYLVDLPNDAKGRAPKLKEKTQFLLLASGVQGRPGEVRLIAPDAQLPYTPELAARLRSILQESVRPDAAPPITGIGRAFHVPGSLPGESETQVFLQTADGRPVSLSILRRPGQTPQWAVALSEIVDNAAAAPRRDTLLWYRLACTLPQTLPPQSMAESGPQEAAAIRADYQLVRNGLGPCARTRVRR